MRIAAFVVGWLIVSGVATLAEAGWNTYANPRFGVAADYPAIFSMRGRPPDNGDGQDFHTPDGKAKLTIWGSYNVLNQSAGEMLNQYRDKDMAYAYMKSGPNFFVLSGTKRGQIVYVRCNLGPKDVVGCLDIEYPAADAAKWGTAVARVSRSLRILPVQVQ